MNKDKIKNFLEVILSNKCISNKTEKTGVIMVYFFNLLYSTIYFFMIRRSKKITVLICSPIIIIWTLIIGGQYGVGTDYFSYMNIFYSNISLEFYYRRKEYIFYFLIKILKNLFKDGQVLFLTVGLLEAILFIFLIKKMLKLKILEKEYSYIFVFIFLAHGTLFYNQMNALRQYFNTYIFVLMIIVALEKKYLLYNICFYIGLNIHRSFILIYPFYVIFKILRKRITLNILIIGLFISIFINFIDVKKYVEILILYLPRYSHYAEKDYFSIISLENKITKLIYFPYIYESIFLLKKLRSSIQREMLNIGIISYIIKTTCLVTTVTNRIGEYFNILALFPVYYLIIYYIKNNNKYKLLFLVGLILGIFIFKVLIVPRGEYLYKFYLFH